MHIDEWKALPDDERHTLVEHIRITHPTFTQLLDEIDACHHYTSYNSLHNPPCLAILGKTGAGKTTLVHEWITRHSPSSSYRVNGNTISPFLFVSIPSKASIKGTAAAFLTTLGDPSTQWNMVTRLYALLKECRVQMIFLDEFQHLREKDTQRVLDAVSDFLKDIINQTSIPMILIGQEDEAEPILSTNPQLSRRVGTPRYLRPFPWKIEQPDTIRVFCTVLESIDQALPLDPSGLGSRNMAYRFFHATDGYIGWMMSLIRRAAHLAITAKSPTITRSLLSSAYDTCIADTLMHQNKSNPFSRAVFPSFSRHLEVSLCHSLLSHEPRLLCPGKISLPLSLAMLASCTIPILSGSSNQKNTPIASISELFPPSQNTPIMRCFLFSFLSANRISPS